MFEDHNRVLRNTFMGKVKLTVGTIVSGGCVEVWVPLVGSKKHPGVKVSGEVLLRVHVEPIAE